MNDYFPGSDKFLESTSEISNSSPREFSILFENTISIIEMSLVLFSATVIRNYQDIIMSPPEDSLKKVKPIRKILRERFTAPTLGTLLELTRNCFHLVDNKNPSLPEKIAKMKEALSKTFLLEEIAGFLNDLYCILNTTTSDGNKPKTIYHPINKKSLLTFLLPLLIEYRNTIKHSRDISLIIQDYLKTNQLDIIVWHSSFVKIMNLIAPICDNIYISRNLSNVYVMPNGNIEEGKKNLCFTVNVTEYNNGERKTYEEQLTFTDYELGEEYQRNTLTYLRLSVDSKSIDIDLFPFLLIHDDTLFFYKRTRAQGYEYYSLSTHTQHVIPTKRKFSHSLFGVGGAGDRQAIFWSEVIPSLNAYNSIKANIPTEGLDDFVGRRRQITQVKEEIIEIPNQNGIIYGPGGVGKTALMLQLSKELFNEKDLEAISFDNVVWISAKNTYYNPLLNLIVDKEKQAESLDNILTVILRFFDYEDVDEYDVADKQELVFQVIEENRVLLILDNFETIPRKEVDRIITFFAVDVKRRLKRHPNHFKVIITSRELIPSGFHQIKLRGLDLREAKQLMDKLYKRYEGRRDNLTDQQKERIHEATHGIPITIKHCFGQIYEFNRSIEDVLTSLAVPSSELIKFSFSEILKLLKKDDLQLKIIILLEVFNFPLMIRQMSDILEIDEYEIVKRIPNLIGFQIVDRINQGSEEKYILNTEISLFAKSIAQENDDIGNTIKKKMASNFSINKQMDYTSEELGILAIFNDYVTKGNYLDAESFIKTQIEKNIKSVLLQFHYAKYLKENVDDVDKAIKVLKTLCETGNKHPNIFRLIISCYISSDVPNYSAAAIYVKELEAFMDVDPDIRYEVAEFYVGWSRDVRVRPRPIDPVEDRKRIGKYKELADCGIKILKSFATKERTHRYHYLLAQAHLNLWENDKALAAINEALALVGSDPNYHPSYSWLKRAIQKKFSLPASRC